MKKLISILLTFALFACIFTGCSNLHNSESKLSIVTTIFPGYDWINQIIGDKASNVEVTMLLDSGVDLHSYQPTATDIIKISECDMFIYVGGESDSWVDDALNNAVNEDMVVINLLEVLGDDIVKKEEFVEGMQDDNHDDEDEHHDEEHEYAYDEHVWLSLNNAKLICKYISDKLAEIDPDNKQTYAVNTEAYIGKLIALDNQYQTTVDSAPVKTLLFGDRFPFRYLVDDYGLEYYAAFSGCSAESEASFETVAFLAKKIDELGLTTVLTIDGMNHRIAQTVIETTKSKNAKILSMNSMQSTTSADIENGVTYLSIMEANLDVLKNALK